MRFVVSPLLVVLAGLCGGCNAGDLMLPGAAQPGGGTAQPSGGTPTPTVTQITSVSPEPSFPTQSVLVGVTVTSTSGTPAGTVTVTDGAASCTAFVAAGQCALTLATAGSKTLTAAFAGSAAFAPSSGMAQHQVILAGTATTLSSSPNPSMEDESVTFAATVTSPFRTPNGSIEFVEGSCATPTRTWGTTSLDPTGQGSFATNNLSVGTHLMLACYLGNDTFAPSASDTLLQQVSDHRHN